MSSPRDKMSIDGEGTGNVVGRVGGGEGDLTRDVSIGAGAFRDTARFVVRAGALDVGFWSTMSGKPVLST